jgi:hypothetical protein
MVLNLVYPLIFAVILLPNVKPVKIVLIKYVPLFLAVVILIPIVLVVNIVLTILVKLIPHSTVAEMIMIVPL